MMQDELLSEDSSKQHKSAWRIETAASKTVDVKRVHFETAQIRLAD